MISGADKASRVHEPEWLSLMTPMNTQVPMRKYNKAPKNQYMFIPLFPYRCSVIEYFRLSHCLIYQGAAFLTLFQSGFLFFLMIKLRDQSISMMIIPSI